MAPQNSTLIHENANFNVDLSHFSPILCSNATIDDEAEISSLKSSDVYEIIESVKSMDKFSKVTSSQVCKKKKQKKILHV